MNSITYFLDKRCFLNLLILFLLLLPSLAFGYKIKVLEPVPGAQGYEFAIYPNEIEKIIPSPGPFIDSNNLPLGDFKYKLRIKKDNQWSPWSNLSEMSVAKKSRPLKINKNHNIEEAAPVSKTAKLNMALFLLVSSRSLDTKNEGVSKKSNGNAVRIGASLYSKYYSSQVFHETGKIFSRTDIGLMKTLSPYFQFGGKILFANARFSDSQKMAQINSVHAFIQASGKYKTKNNFLFTLNGAGTIQGSLLANLFVTKSWVIKDKIRVSPSIGYEELSLKNSRTSLNSSSFLAGIFVGFPL